VKEVLRGDEQSARLEHLGENFTLVGVLISDPLVVGQAASLVSLQDETGGLTLFTEDTNLLAGHFKRGDLVEVQGKLAQFKGMGEIHLGTIRQLDTRALPAPREVLAADLNGNRYKGELVRMAGQLIVPADFGNANRGAVLRDRSGEIPVVISSRFFTNSRFIDRLLQGGLVVITGVAGQSCEKPPFHCGYRLMPRDPEDVAFAPVPPYRAIFIGAALVLLLMSWLYLLTRRRSAEQRAREMSKLSESLKESEAALRKSEERYRELFENANDMVFTLDLAGNLVSLNKAGERITGYSREEAQSKSVMKCVKSELLGPTKQMLFGELAGEPRRDYETEVIRKDGREVALEVSSRLIFEDGKSVAVQGIARDITNRKGLEEQLRQSQKMEAIGRLAGGVAHDFNNLLTVIKGHAEMLEDRIGPTHRAHKDIEQIQQAADRAASLTQQLLAFSRQQVLKPRVLDLNAVVTEMAKMLPRLIGEDIELLMLPSAQPGQVRADPGQLEQVILNLAVNARDAMPRGGKLTIEISEAQVDHRYVKQHADVEAGPYVLLAVSDTGCGMDAETQKHIFDPFFTTKELGKGTGLGLATVYGVVKQSGGFVWVYSEVDKGSTFKIYLPRVEQAFERVSPVKDMSQSWHGQETVLIVEDEDAVRELTREFLETRGYTVMEARNGAEALQIAASHPNPIELLVSDVIMPGMSGPELAQRLSALHPEIKVLYVSGYTADAVPPGILNLRAPFLPKPFSRQALLQNVREILEGTSPAASIC
jgi:PAS domain S-box-containing protein